MTHFKIEILHMQGGGYSYLDSCTAGLSEASADAFKESVLKIALDSMEDAEIGGFEKKPNVKTMANDVINYWDNNIHEHLNELFSRALDRADRHNEVDTGAIPLPEVIDDVPELDDSALYDLLEENIDKPEFYAELRMSDSFGVSVIDIHSDETKGHNSIVRVVTIRLDGEL